VSTNSDHRTPDPSDEESKSSTSSKDGQCNKENYHVDTGKIPQKRRKVGVAQKSASRQKNSENKKPSHSAKHVTHSLLQDELEADESSTEIKNKNDDVMNPFAFNK